MPIQHGENDPFLDLVFVLDCTGSMGPYIATATAKIEEISRRIFASKLLADPEDLRVGIVAYRDYPPEDFQEWITRRFPFTSDMSQIKGYLSQLRAIGGGDGPEAVATALYEAATQMAWRPDRGAQVVVIITDAPPHGLNPKSGEKFSNGDPHDAFGKAFSPAKLLKFFMGPKAKGIHVLTIQCEPTLTTYYPLGLSFYKGLSTLTNGRIIPLGNAEILADSIVVFALETLDLRRVLYKLGGGAISDPTHPNAKFHTLFRAVAGIHPSEVEVERQLQALYENPTDDLAERIERATATTTPEEAVKELRAHLKDEQCHGCETTISHSLSAEGRHNMQLFMKSHITGVLDGDLKADHGSCVVGDCAKQTVSLKKASLSDGQIKRLAHMYTTRFSAADA